MIIEKQVIAETYDDNSSSTEQKIGICREHSDQYCRTRQQLKMPNAAALVLNAKTIVICVCLVSNEYCRIATRTGYGVFLKTSFRNVRSLCMRHQCGFIIYGIW